MSYGPRDKRNAPSGGVPFVASGDSSAPGHPTGAAPHSKVDIYTDGACSGNPGPGGWGAILHYDSRRRVVSGHADHTTNQRMELTAAIEGLKVLKRPCRVVIHSDSAYLIRGVTENQRHKANPDLWKTLLDLLAKHEVTFVKATEGSGDTLFDDCHKVATSRAHG